MKNNYTTKELKNIAVLVLKLSLVMLKLWDSVYLFLHCGTI